MRLLKDTDGRLRDLWAGIDVGGRRKGFDAAVIDRQAVICLERHGTVDSVVEMLTDLRPRVVAIDSPRTAAVPGQKSREAERELVTAGVCAIRYTPDLETLLAPHRTHYYDWIVQGLKLYEALAVAEPETGWQMIEVFPTASWSRWAGRRPKGVTRAAWSRDALADWQLVGVPTICGQDARDAIAAALTARLYPQATELFGEIVVPAVG
jgi:predicted nuclease with RNAse H fold